MYADSLQSSRKRQLLKNIFAIAAPLILENFLTMSASLVSTAQVGRLSELDITVQGISTRLISTVTMLARGIATGLTVATAYSWAQGNVQKCKKILRDVSITAVPLIAVLTAIILCFPRTFIKMFTSDSSTIEATVEYFKLMTLAIPAVCARSITVGFFNGCQNTATPMYISIVTVVLNLILGQLFIFTLGYGLRGSAYSYLISQYVAAVLILILQQKLTSKMQNSAKDIPVATGLDTESIKLVYTVGMPVACESLMYNLAAVALSRAILPYGTNYFSAYQLGGQAEAICYIVGMSLLTTSTTLAADAIGKGDIKLFRSCYKVLMIMALIVASVSAVIMLFLPTQLMRILTNQESLIPIGVGYLYVMAAAQFPQDLGNVLSGFLRAAGYKKISLIASILGIWGIRIPVAFLAGIILKLDVSVVWWGITLDQAFRCTLFLAVFYKKKLLSTAIDAMSEKLA